MLYTICLALFLPLISFLFLSLNSNALNRRLVQGIGCLAVLIPFLCFIGLAIYTSNHNIPSENFLLYPWISIQSIDAKFLLHLDHLSLLMTLIITGVGFLIHVYSIGYMDEEVDLNRYFACMNLFIFSMLLLVLAGDLLLLFIGWEGVGLASYLLIGFWYKRKSAASAATKAFIVNRIGDAGFLLGLLLTLTLFGTTEITAVSQMAAEQFPDGSSVITLLTCLFLCGAVAKSAQLPLHIWLPDAMEGPTPVSALIHAATMVTAGVYLIVRLHSLYILAPLTMFGIGIIGGATALFAALAALNQTDLKRVLAYSTISQLGFMFLACGIGAFYAAIFHLTTHAFMKALLFLSAGNVVHMLHGTTEMGKMGGLSKQLKTTQFLFLIGVLAMSGIPPLAAFFSKDLILEVEYLSGFTTLFYSAAASSILTAIYLTRAYFLTFRGAPLADHSEVKEAPKIMLVPVIVLGALAIVGGFLGFSLGQTPFLEEYLQELGITEAEHQFTQNLFGSHETWASIAMAIFGVSAAFIAYTFYSDKWKGPIAFLKKGFYINEIYTMCFIVPFNALSRFIAKGLEPYIFTQSLQTSALAVDKAAFGMQKLQSGQVRSYAAWMILGGVALLIYFVS